MDGGPQGMRGPGSPTEDTGSACSRYCRGGSGEGKGGEAKGWVGSG